MTLSYLDTSAALKLVIDEPESVALVAELSQPTRRLASSWLLHTEMHCAAGRHPTIIPLASVSAVIDAELARAAEAAEIRVTAPS